MVRGQHQGCCHSCRAGASSIVDISPPSSSAKLCRAMDHSPAESEPGMKHERDQLPSNSFFDEASTQDENEASFKPGRSRRRPRSPRDGVNVAGPNGSEPPSKKQCMLFHCEACGTSYTTKRALARHFHSDLHRQTVGLPPAQKYLCTLCDRTFSREHDRLRHENETHKGIKRAGHKREMHQSKVEKRASTGARRTRSKPMVQTVNLDQDRSFIIEDDTPASQTDWEPPASRVDVFAGNGNWTSEDEYFPKPKSANKHLKVLGIGDAGIIAARNGSVTSSKSCGSSTKSDVCMADLGDRSWFAEHTDEEREEETPPSTEDSLKSNHSVAADSAVDLPDMENHDPHEPRMPSIVTYDYRTERPDSSGDSVSALSGRASAETVERVSSEGQSRKLPRWPKATVIQRPGRPDETVQIPTIVPQSCIFCEQSFHEDLEKLLPHLREHLNSLKSEFLCSICKIGFVHKRDLQKHVMCADMVGHCGFNFKHNTHCMGHHPPETGLQKDELTDFDRYRMCVQLRHWEQSQLRAYMAEIERLIATRNRPPSVCYSIEALFRRSKGSMSSYAFSIDTLRSAPCDRNADGQMDVRGLEGRLQKMSLNKPASSSPHTKKKLPRLPQSGSNLNKSLYNAATSGDLIQIAKLVNSGADPSASLGDQPILSAAAYWADVDTVKLLLDLGAQATAPDAKYGCALSRAARAGKADVVKLLLDHGADANQLGGEFGCPLAFAAVKGSTEVASILLDAGAEIHQPIGHWGSPLSAAAANGHLDFVRLLIEHGADPNHPGGVEGTPLGFATWYGHMDIVKLLVAAGADVNARGGNHVCPLFGGIVRAVKGEGDLEMVKLLLSFGAFMDRQDFQSMGSNSEVLDLLEQSSTYY